MTDKATTSPADQRASDHDEPVPRLPRGKLIKLTGPQMFRIVFFAVLLVGVLLLRQPCSDGIGRFVESFDTADAGPTETDAGGMADPGSQTDVRSRLDPAAVGGFYRLTGDMSEEEIRATLRKAGVQVDDAGPPDASPDAGFEVDAAPNRP